MKSGYKILWTDHALNELKTTIEYLENYFPILKFNTMYYRIKDQEVQILSFFSNRQHPKRRKI
ncbi:hypothetical protein FW774_00955 (plasmid) [Pedobacter sp. BS3]|nr:hypothetical protein FW774_00955 [Pedobacter sp. BS3]